MFTRDRDEIMDDHQVERKHEIKRLAFYTWKNVSGRAYHIFMVSIINAYTS